ncbi:hypothetical protein PUN28_000289 [Cardiocondyla obscurior]|uniref:Uncharacterized protein n=1 Tax=Cardiocondyla obscurior TaxID=286306 RepID=A0AAW2GYU5_9HYME
MTAFFFKDDDEIDINLNNKIVKKKKKKKKKNGNLDSIKKIKMLIKHYNIKEHIKHWFQIKIIIHETSYFKYFKSFEYILYNCTKFIYAIFLSNKFQFLLRHVAYRKFQSSNFVLIYLYEKGIFFFPSIIAFLSIS